MTSDQSTPTQSEPAIGGRDALKLRRFLFRTVQDVDRTWKPVCPTFSAAMVLAAVSVIGTHVPTLVSVSGQSAPFVMRVLSRLRKMRVLRGSTIRTYWADDRAGNVAFILDAMTAAGAIDRAADPKVREKVARVRAARLIAGLCVNCGKARDDQALKTCSACRDAVRKSAAKRWERDQFEAPTVKHGSHWYRLNDEQRAAYEEASAGARS